MNLFDKFLQSFLLFCKIIAPQLFELKFCRAHFHLEELFASDKKFLNLILPRGLGKTTLTIFYILYVIFVKKKGKRQFVVIVSKTAGHASNCLETIKNILDYNETFKKIFGYYGSATAKKWNTEEVHLKDGTIIIAKGMGQQIRGLNYFGFRPTLVILDDPEDENNTKTSDAVNNNIDWLLKGVLPGLGRRYGDERVIVIGTPIVAGCVVETLSNMANWATVRYSYLNKDETKSLWEDNISVKELLEEKANYEKIGKISVFYSERMCKIVGDEAQIFKESYFNYHNYTYVRHPSKNGYGVNAYLIDEADVEQRLIPVNVYCGVDPAATVSARADYTAIVVLAVDASYNIYVLECFRKRLEPHDIVEEVIRIYNKFLPIQTRVESIAYQNMLRQEIKRRTYIPGMEIKETSNVKKELRIASLQPLFRQGRVYFRRKGDEDMKLEFQLFPKGQFDDTLDAFYYARRGIILPVHTAEDAVTNKNKKTSKSYSYEENEEIDWALV